MIVDIVKGTDWEIPIVIAIRDGLTEAQMITELTGATVTALIENSAGTLVATCATSLAASTRTVTVSLANATTGALTAQDGLYMDLKYTTTAAKIHAPPVGAGFRIVTNPWA